MNETVRKSLSVILLGFGMVMVAIGVYWNTQGPNPCSVNLSEALSVNASMLVELHRCAGKQQKTFAELARQQAQQLENNGAFLYARIERMEVLESDPQPADVIAIANGFLRTAQYYLREENYLLTQTFDVGHTPKRYLEGAQFYFNLSLEFSAAINESYNTNDQKIIVDIIQCIDELINNTHPEPLYCPLYQFAYSG